MLRLLGKSRNRPAIRALAVAICSLALCSCGERPLPPQPEHEASGEISVAIRMGKVAAANISRAEIVITGSGITGEMKQQLTISGNTITGIVTGIPAGSDRRFMLNGYNASNILTYQGSATATVTAGQRVRVTITVRSVSGTSSSTKVVLSIISPVVANYTYSSIKGPVQITGYLNNPSNDTARNVKVTLDAMNNSGGPMGQTSTALSSLPPGRTFFSATFVENAFASNAAPISKINYSITHSLGGPDNGSVSVSK